MDLLLSDFDTVLGVAFDLGDVDRVLEIRNFLKTIFLDRYLGNLSYDLAIDWSLASRFTGFAVREANLAVQMFAITVAFAVGVSTATVSMPVPMPACTIVWSMSTFADRKRIVVSDDWCRIADRRGGVVARVDNLVTRDVVVLTKTRRRAKKNDCQNQERKVSQELH